MPTAKTIIDVVTDNLTCNSDINQVEESALERCVQLLEHAEQCRAQGECANGPHCYRACRVLLHHRSCNTEQCSVCRQLKPLCHLHARRCQRKTNSCSMPYCHNGRELTPRIRSRKSDTPAAQKSEPDVPVNKSMALFRQRKSADLPKCLDKKRVTRNVNLSITSRPHHHSSHKRHLSDKRLHGPNSYSEILASKMESMPEWGFLWKAKVSLVPLK